MRTSKRSDRPNIVIITFVRDVISKVFLPKSKHIISLNNTSVKIIKRQRGTALQATYMYMNIH